jgi:cytochrome P450
MKHWSHRIRALSDANGEAKMYAFSIPFSIENFQREQSAGYHPSPLEQRVPTLFELHFKAQSQFAELLIELECWAIAIPSLRVFRTALNAATYDVQQSFDPLFPALLPVLPMDPPAGQTADTIIHPPPSPQAFSELRRLIGEYVEARSEFGCYVDDLTREAQNNLLFGLFEERVPHPT